MSNKSFNEDKINEVSDTNNEVEKDIANEQQELNIDNNSENDQDLYDEIKKLKISLDEQTIKADEYLDLLKRKAAEFENFRKRTIKEKSEIYVNAFCDAIKIFLPVIDNFERALVCDENASEQSLKDGMELIYTIK